MNRTRLLAVIERVFDAVDRPGQTLRIDRLSLDLGTMASFDPGEIERRLEAALHRGLAEAISGLGQGRAGNALVRTSDHLLGIFEHYLLRGTWPYHAGLAPNARPSDLFRELLDAVPEGLLAVLLRLRGSDRAVRRLVRQLPADLLAAVLERLDPGQARWIVGYAEGVVRAYAADPAPEMSRDAMHETVWTIVLRDALQRHGTRGNRRAFVQRLVETQARDLGMPFEQLLGRLIAQMPQTSQVLSPSLLEILREIGISVAHPPLVALREGLAPMAPPSVDPAERLESAIAADRTAALAMLDQGGDAVWNRLRLLPAGRLLAILNGGKGRALPGPALDRLARTLLAPHPAGVLDPRLLSRALRESRALTFELLSLAPSPPSAAALHSTLGARDQVFVELLVAASADSRAFRRFLVGMPDHAWRAIEHALERIPPTGAETAARGRFRAGARAQDGRSARAGVRLSARMSSERGASAAAMRLIEKLAGAAAAPALAPALALVEARVQSIQAQSTGELAPAIEHALSIDATATRLWMRRYREEPALLRRILAVIPPDLGARAFLSPSRASDLAAFAAAVAMTPEEYRDLVRSQARLAYGVAATFAVHAAARRLAELRGVAIGSLLHAALAASAPRTPWRATLLDVLAPVRLRAAGSRARPPLQHGAERADPETRSDRRRGTTARSDKGNASHKAAAVDALAVVTGLLDRGDRFATAALARHLRSAALRRAIVARWPARWLERLLALLRPREARVLIAARSLTARALREETHASTWAMALAAAVEAPSGKAISAYAHAVRSAVARDPLGLRHVQAAARVAGEAAFADALAAAADRSTDRPVERDSAPSLPFPPEAEGSGALLVRNAGLVLIAPYLPQCFAQAKLWTSDADGTPGWTDPAAPGRAVHLLQYLVDGRTDAPEPGLALCKILCGLPMDWPVPVQIVPSALERDVAESLLAAVIANWPILAGSTIAALRETFLVREGCLSETELGWSLVVERKTLDVLVDAIPWSYSMILHPWMHLPLSVAW